ncbi:DUF1236 domain-containing protein [Neorhizobium petrolearium]|uniref:DUF1236 domain-containing protein n=1 Tax=Neorhizobium petrolearium TaxID=515361 RepID=A0ABY8M2G2_9HYPH|nr:DUF1236 domain-containing protein [Neorhizobium petrolearium]MCC2608471.1 DUF1236 domain-containing protein [Neorhizobium petrolearium]WGI68743.1 DUF1236 domain-containing protein [Neorhizobium petrolearium]
MKPLVKHTLAMALLAGSTLSAVPAIAQTESPSAGQSGGGSGAPILPRRGTSGDKGSSGTMTPGAPSQAQPSQGMQGSAQQQPKPGTDNGSTNAQSQGTDQRPNTQGSDTAQQPTDQPGETDGSTTARSGSGSETRTPATSDSAGQNDGAEQQDPDRAATDRPSSETTGSIDISTEQKTEIRNVLVENRVEPADIDVDVSVGVAVPQTVELHPLPPRIVEIVPAYRGYEYFVLADGRIIIVEPATHEVVYILTG